MKIKKYRVANASLVADLQQCRKELNDSKAKAAKISAANQKKQQALKEALIEDCNRKCKKLEQQVRELQQSVVNDPPGTLAQGLCSSVFSRSQYYIFEWPESILSRTAKLQQEWNALCPTHNLTFGIAGDIAYGEASFGTMARVSHVITSELAQLGKPLQPGDVFLDWGCGAGKWVLIARELLEEPDLIVVGIEKNDKIMQLCHENLMRAQRMGKTGINVLKANSGNFTSFCPARVVVNYDGGTQKLLQKFRMHCHIMRNVFCSSTVDVVVSTRLGSAAFRRYFANHLVKFCGSLWKCLYIPNGYFGGSKFNVNVWFRLSSMQNI